jgi:hypothetical protein
VPTPHASSDRSRSPINSGRLAGDATAVVTAKVVAIVGMDRGRTPTRRRACVRHRREQARATDRPRPCDRPREALGERSVEEERKRTSKIVRAAPVRDLIVVTRPTRSCERRAARGAEPLAPVLRWVCHHFCRK